MTSLKVVDVVPGWDMRRIRLLREMPSVRRLKPGECVIAANNSRKMARIVWAGGDFAQIYARRGMRFSLPLIREQIRSGLTLALELGKYDSQRKRKPALRVVRKRRAA